MLRELIKCSVQCGQAQPGLIVRRAEIAPLLAGPIVFFLCPSGLQAYFPMDGLLHYVFRDGRFML